MDSDKLSKAIISLVDLVALLRGPGGCPWDARQTDSTVKTYLLEEAYEVLDAISRSSAPEVCSELGDLLFQILFLAQLAAERKEFDFVDVVETVTEKMIRRHPHVFGETKVDNAEDVALNWTKIKEAEKGPSNNRLSSLQSVPVNLPALLRAHRLGERASSIGLSRPEPGESWNIVQENYDKLRFAIDRAEKKQFGEAIGNILFSLVDLSRNWGFNAEQLLMHANQRFLKRFEETDPKKEASP
ncbi:MAG: nucleoside triphosphate pyrophosphohydrolase [Thermodesulfobacteriota bacterium]|nr:nucleoside triphosphate pyrophosphohydrolase [Thermodesulfobacteriota bacterium]